MGEKRDVKLQIEDVWFRDQCREFYENATEDVDFLKAVWKKIDAPERWIKGFHARLLDGSCVPYWKVDDTLEHQCAWSLYGALEAEAIERYKNSSEMMERILRARQALSLACRRKNEENPMISLTEYNDKTETSHDDIRELVEYAIDVRWEQDRLRLAKTGPFRRGRARENTRKERVDA